MKQSEDKIKNKISNINNSILRILNCCCVVVVVMSSVPFVKSAKEEEKEDNERYERYTKGFVAMTIITSITAVAIVAACLLYKKASCDASAGPGGSVASSIFFQLSCKLIGSEYDPKSPGLLGCILFALAFGWFIILSIFLLDTRPMMDLFDSTDVLRRVKTYLVVPCIAVIGFVLGLGTIAFIPSFGLYHFVDKKTSEAAEESLPFSDTDSILTKLVRRLGLILPFRRLYTNILNLLTFSKTVSTLGIIGLVISALVLFIVYVSKQFTDGLSNIFNIVLVIVGCLVAVAIVISVYDSLAKTEKDYENMKSTSVLYLFIKVFRYIPCLIIDGVNWIRRELSITTRPVWILLFIEAAIVGAYFLVPLLFNATLFSGSTALTREITDISTVTRLNTLNSVGIVRTPECASKLKTKHSYAVSGWLFLSSHPPSMTGGGNKFVNVLDFGGVPSIEYNAATNELRFRLKVRTPTKTMQSSTIQTETDATSIQNTYMSLRDVAKGGSSDETTEAYENMVSRDDISNEMETTRASASATASVMSDATKGLQGMSKLSLPAMNKSSSSSSTTKTRPPPEESTIVTIYTMSNVPLQRWNHFVYNYDGSNIDIFMNNELVTSVSNKFPLIEHGDIVAGASRGVIGNLSNVVAFSNHLTKDVISAIYTKEDPRGLLWATYSNTKASELMHNV